MVGAIGQVVENGEASSLTFSAEGGFLNDADLDSDNIGGSQDLCPAESAACRDVDLDGCIDVPDPDADVDGITKGACDCDDGNVQAWGTPGELVDLIWTLEPAPSASTRRSVSASAGAACKEKYSPVRRPPIAAVAFFSRGRL